MISKHPLSGAKATGLIVSLKTSVYLVSQSFKSPFANVKINFSLSVNKMCNITCAGVTHLISYEEFNHLGRNSFCDIMLQNTVHQEVDLPSPGPRDMGGSLQGYLLHCSLFRREGT